MVKKYFLFFIFSFSFSFFIVSCATKEKPILPADVLYEDGTVSMKNKKYSKAIKAFKDIRDHYPFSEYSIDSELNLADAYFLQKSFLEASEAYKEFELLHPRHQAIPYVLFQIALSYQSLFISVDREINSLLEAQKYYNKILEYYPKTKYAESSEKSVLFIKKKLADRDVYLANFYWRTKRYTAAWLRYEFIIRTHVDFPKIVEYATVQSEAAYLKKMQQDAQTEYDRMHFQIKDLFKWL
ncbi:MAG: outer membrane protein assembly factor BamD [Desulfovibrionaceae bacterium]